jgi:hypothetical protein
MRRLRQFLHPASERKASWLQIIERTAIAKRIFNADHPKVAAQDRLTNLDHLEDKADRGRLDS